MELTLTISIIILTAIISFTALSNDKVMNDLVFYPPAIYYHKQYYRFITSGFLHADFIHLFFNMFTLFFFGTMLERIFEAFGMPRYLFLIFYMGGLVVSSIPTYLKNKTNSSYRSLGASGAVSAVLFAFILYDPWQTIRVFFIPIPAIVFAVLYVYYSIYMAKKGGDNINHDAHLWGAIYGVVFFIIAQPKIVNLFLERIMHPRFDGF